MLRAASNFEDDSPLALDEIYISSLTYPDFLDRITGDISFYELLDNYYNVSRGESVCEIAVRIANAEQASILHCQAGDPLFLLQKRVLQLTAHRSIIHALLCAVIESPIPFAHKIQTHSLSLI